jgi:hypothetical protein
MVVDLDYSAWFSLLSVSPPIVFAPSDALLKPLSDGRLAFEHMADVINARCFFLLQPWWFVPKDVVRWACARDAIGRLIEAHPGSHVLVLSNDPEEQPALTQLGIDSVFQPQNFIVDSDIYQPDKSVTKVYDAIYNAKLVPWKRHYLAAGVPRLALLYGRFDATQEYLAKLMSLLPHATFKNGNPLTPAYRRFNGREVARVCNESKVGLCLSACEGAMYASVEYLLCGLPLVSTRSKGGREAFFNDDYCSVVDDTPEAVASAAHDLIMRRIDPHYIRGETLKKVHHYRQTFIDLIDDIQRSAGCPARGLECLNSVKGRFGGFAWQSLRTLQGATLRSCVSETGTP